MISETDTAQPTVASMDHYQFRQKRLLKWIAMQCVS